MPLVWNDKYSVKVQQMDTQHKQIFDMINEFHTTLKEVGNKEAMAKIILQLLDYGKFHLATEEGLMRRYKYPEYPQHKQAHEEFLVKVAEFKKRIDEGKMVLPIEVGNFVQNWLLNHIVAIDQRYSNFFNQQGLV